MVSQGRFGQRRHQVGYILRIEYRGVQRSASRTRIEEMVEYSFESSPTSGKDARQKDAG